jgi:hypothetical protein
MTSFSAVFDASQFVSTLDNHWRSSSRLPWRAEPLPADVYAARRALGAALEHSSTTRVADPEAALARLRTALDACLACGPRDPTSAYVVLSAATEVARCLCLLAAARWRSGAMAEARALYKQELPLRRWLCHRVVHGPSTGDRLVAVLRNLGECCQRLGDSAAARALLLEAFGRAKREPRPLTVASATELLDLTGSAAKIAVEAGNLERGQALAVDAAASLRALVDVGEAGALVNTAAALGVLALDNDWLHVAADVFDAALPVARSRIARRPDDLMWYRRIRRLFCEANDALYRLDRDVEARRCAAEEVALARACVALSLGARDDRTCLVAALTWAAQLADEANEAPLAGDLRDAAAREQRVLG